MQAIRIPSVNASSFVIDIMGTTRDVRFTSVSVVPSVANMRRFHLDDNREKQSEKRSKIGRIFVTLNN